MFLAEMGISKSVLPHREPAVGVSRQEGSLNPPRSLLRKPAVQGEEAQMVLLETCREDAGYVLASIWVATWEYTPAPENWGGSFTII